MSSSSKATEETEGYQVLPFSKTPRVGRTRKNRPRLETPNENEVAELSLLAPSEEEGEGTKRVTRTASRRALTEVNAVQEPPTAVEPKPAPVKRPSRGRRKKAPEEVAAPPAPPVVAPSKRMTRAASRKAAAVKEVIDLAEEEDVEEEVLSSQQDEGQVKPLESNMESDTVEEVCVGDSQW